MSKTRGLARVLSSLGIFNVGVATAQDLAEEFVSVDNLMDATVERLKQCKGVGPERAESIYKYFHSPAGEKTIRSCAR